MVGGTKEVHVTETFDGSDLTPKQFEWMRSYIAKYGNQKVNLDSVKANYPKMIPVAFAGIVYNLSKRGYLLYFEESNGKFVQAHQKAIEILPAIEYTPRPVHVDYPQPVQARPQTVQTEAEVVQFAQQNMRNYDQAAIENAQEEVETGFEERQIQENIPKPVAETFRHLPQPMLDEEKVTATVKKMVEKEILPLYDKLENLSSHFAVLNKNVLDLSMSINVKKRPPEEVLADLEGQIREIVNNLKAIENAGTDNSLPEALKSYKEARRDGNSYQEREYAWNVVPRQESMIAWYLHLVVQMGRMIAYLKNVKGVHVSVDEGSPTDEIMDQGENNG